ncbi:MAG: 50S ribosomal protein L24 [Kiritimatiellae bacterium]|nr:50S ribosomal protein L24 [Kiritimatiellia bacterium]
MPAKVHIRKNDVVLARAGGAAAGKKTGKVLQVFPGKRCAIVEGLNFVHKTLRKSQDNPKGSIIRKEAPINLANLMLYCPHCKKGVRIKRQPDENRRKIRTCRKCGHKFD